MDNFKELKVWVSEMIDSSKGCIHSIRAGGASGAYRNVLRKMNQMEGLNVKPPTDRRSMPGDLIPDSGDLFEKMGAIHGISSCPHCDHEFEDMHDGYTGPDGEEYPKFYNEYKFQSPNGDVHDWQELHNCPECSKYFYIDNSKY